MRPSEVDVALTQRTHALAGSPASPRVGEEVVDVPPKLSARTPVFETCQGRKTDRTDDHSVVLVGSVDRRTRSRLGHAALVRAKRTVPGPPDAGTVLFLRGASSLENGA